LHSFSFLADFRYPLPPPSFPPSVWRVGKIFGIYQLLTLPIIFISLSLKEKMLTVVLAATLTAYKSVFEPLGKKGRETSGLPHANPGMPCGFYFYLP
jgi:hypothetical protein